MTFLTALLLPRGRRDCVVEAEFFVVVTEPRASPFWLLDRSGLVFLGAADCFSALSTLRLAAAEVDLPRSSLLVALTALLLLLLLLLLLPLLELALLPEEEEDWFVDLEKSKP